MLLKHAVAAVHAPARCCMLRVLYLLEHTNHALPSNGACVYLLECYQLAINNEGPMTAKARFKLLHSRCLGHVMMHLTCLQVSEGPVPYHSS